MAKKLKIDKDFTPCPVDDDDEIYRNGLFHFNITKMLVHIHDNQNIFKIEDVMVCDFIKEHSKINESHVDSTDTSKPVILAEIAPGRYNLIDGNHRMEKVRRLGVEKISAYRLEV